MFLHILWFLRKIFHPHHMKVIGIINGTGLSHHMEVIGPCHSHHMKVIGIINGTGHSHHIKVNGTGHSHHMEVIGSTRLHGHKVSFKTMYSDSRQTRLPTYVHIKPLYYLKCIFLSIKRLFFVSNLSHCLFIAFSNIWNHYHSWFISFFISLLLFNIQTGIRSKIFLKSESRQTVWA